MRGVSSRIFAAWLGEWLEQPEQDREDPNPFINAIGSAFGQALVDALGLEWAVVSDEHGTEIAVHGQPGDILVFPPNLVAKRFARRATRGFSPRSTNKSNSTCSSCAAADPISPLPPNGRAFRTMGVFGLLRGG
jgi:hypothetical protein